MHHSDLHICCPFCIVWKFAVTGPFAATSTTVYALVIDVNSCQDTAAVNITVNPLPDVSGNSHLTVK